MRWNITDMLVSPATGTAFALARTQQDKAVIVWYRGHYFLRPGNILVTDSKGIIIDGRMHEFKVIHTMPYFPTIWKTLKKIVAHVQGVIIFLYANVINKTNAYFRCAPMG